MKFSQFAKYIEKIEETSSRLTITHLLSDLFKKLHEDEIDKAMYLLVGRVSPSYEAVEFGMAEKMIIRSVATALSLDKKYFEKEFKKIGDLGLAVEHFKKQFQTFDQTDHNVLKVFESLRQMAVSGGMGSQEKKMNILAHLIRELDPLSCKFLVRIPIGAMRLGFSEMTILDALSWMIKGDKSLRPAIEKAYHVRPDIGLIGKVAKQKNPVEKFQKINPEIFIPILMMRAERLSSGEEIIKKIGECSVEPKYDGFRLQIHYRKKDGIKIYSRNLEEVSVMYPDLVEAVKKQVKADEVIFEGEAIGFDPVSGNLLPFQETVQRKRKYDIEAKSKEIPLKLFSFELLYLNGKNFLTEPFSSRRKELAKIIKSSKDQAKDSIFLASDEIISDPKKLELMFDDAISKGLEGVIAKKVTGIYQAGARGWNWIKFKRSYSSKIEDTVDCLVMGYDFGKGKRTGFGIGAFLVGVLDQKNDKFVTIAKVGTGLTDDEWRKLKDESGKSRVKKAPKNYDIDKMMDTDVWLSPKIVVEIKADEITRSSVHTAGRILRSTKSGHGLEVDVPGFALRFPRLERFREDKNAGETTTLTEIEKMFKRQKI